jgi:hypothetical protein
MNVPFSRLWTLSCKLFHYCKLKQSNLKNIKQLYLTSLSIPFYFTKPKVFATIFLEQARKRQGTWVVPSYRYPCIFVLLRALRDSLLCKHNNFKQVLTLYPHKTKILRWYKCAVSKRLFNVIAGKPAITKRWIITLEITKRACITCNNAKQ